MWISPLPSHAHAHRYAAEKKQRLRAQIATDTNTTDDATSRILSSTSPLPKGYLNYSGLLDGWLQLTYAFFFCVGVCFLVGHGRLCNRGFFFDLKKDCVEEWDIMPPGLFLRFPIFSSYSPSVCHRPWSQCQLCRNSE